MLARRNEIRGPCVKVGLVPDIIGQVVILTVSDANRSAALYCDLLGTRYIQPDGHVGLVHLAEPRSGGAVPG